MEDRAALQIDLDGSWTYSAYLGKGGDAWDDVLYRKALPLLLDLLSERGLVATLFLVGRDLRVGWKAELLRRALDDGHEIASHSMNHILRFSALARDEKEREIRDARCLCLKVLGAEQVGFRAPGFDIDTETLCILRDMGFLYDSSMIPTYAYPLLLKGDRIWHLLRGRRIPSWDHGPRLGWFASPESPYHPLGPPGSGDGPSLLEIPVSTHPVLRLPFHLAFGLRLGRRWFELSRSSLRRRHHPLVYLIHLKDLRVCLERGDGRVLQLLGHVLDTIRTEYQAVTTRGLAQVAGEVQA